MEPEKEFPARGKALMQLEEREPVFYKAHPNGSLQESQKDWEMQAGSIIVNLGKLP